MKAVRPPVDWEAIEREYRKGVESVREIAAAFGITHAAIQKRAKRDGWTRDLAERIRKEVASKVAAPVATTEAATIAEGVAKGVELLGRHQRRAARLLRAVDRAIDRLEADGGISPDKLATGLNALASATKTLTGLERQAHGLSDDPPESNELTIVVEDQWARQ